MSISVYYRRPVSHDFLLSAFFELTAPDRITTPACVNRFLM
jgi:hypothetical protein